MELSIVTPMLWPISAYLMNCIYFCLRDAYTFLSYSFEKSLVKRLRCNFITSTFVNSFLMLWTVSVLFLACICFLANLYSVDNDYIFIYLSLDFDRFLASLKLFLIDSRLGSSLCPKESLCFSLALSLDFEVSLARSIDLDYSPYLSFDLSFDNDTSFFLSLVLKVSLGLSLDFD